jgi:DNA-binding CsgD family transcriptional regulator
MSQGSQLTEGELKVLREIGQGVSSGQIASSLFMDIERVEELVQSIKQKLDLPDKTAMAVWAVRNGLTD